MVGDYRVITLCGSVKFKDEFLIIQKKLSLEGNIVISVGFFDNEVLEDRKTEIDELLKNFVELEQIEVSKNEGFFSGKKVVLTGTLSNFSRTQAEEIIESQGGCTTSSVTKATDIVLVGENPGSKFEKAKSLGIYTMFEDEFVKHIN